MKKQISSSFKNSLEAEPIHSCFNVFSKDITHFSLPDLFTFPFCYEPHPLAILAAEELQSRYLDSSHFKHDFGIHSETGGIGKMFGVLVVKSENGSLGYLAAFSGKLGDSNHHEGFVPPVFDTLDPHGFYKKGEAELNILNRKIESLEQEPVLQEAQELLQLFMQDAMEAVKALKFDIKLAKIARDQRRTEARTTLTGVELTTFNDLLDQESKRLQIRLKELNRHWNEKISRQQSDIEKLKSQIDQLKKERKFQSGYLQQKLFEQYSFLNADKVNKNLLDIFTSTEGIAPPAGAGECAAPKLLHYAFRHDLQPIALAEFWWGRSPLSEVRRHRAYYPACKLKCEPILSHTLSATPMDPNPLIEDLPEVHHLQVVYEDEYLLAINKPIEFLSVPGKQITDSVYTRLKIKYPDATGPLIVHRLDMSTSGLMLIAKSKEVHQNLQAQFIKRKVRKTYIAVLEGVNLPEEGIIDLPLRVDLEDRPRQLVCYTYGKPALTQWKKLSEQNGETRVAFTPITGRTHQLRVHAAHTSGLNTPIKGDDLYGKRADRLYLHAESIILLHPIHKTELKIHIPADF